MVKRFNYGYIHNLLLFFCAVKGCIHICIVAESVIQETLLSPDFLREFRSVCSEMTKSSLFPEVDLVDGQSNHLFKGEMSCVIAVVVDSPVTNAVLSFI